MAEIQITGTDDLRRALEEAGDLALRALAASMVEVMSEIVTEAANNAPKDTGILRASSGVLPPVIVGTRVSVTGGFGGQAADYAPVMEFGRRPGAKPPPVEPIREWARRHGLPEKAAFPIARSIGRKGIRGHHMLENAFRSRLPRIGFDLAEGVTAAWQRLRT